jgi:hypothetical protein
MNSENQFKLNEAPDHIERNEVITPLSLEDVIEKYKDDKNIEFISEKEYSDIYWSSDRSLDTFRKRDKYEHPNKFIFNMHFSVSAHGEVEDKKDEEDLAKRQSSFDEALGINLLKPFVLVIENESEPAYFESDKVLWPVYKIEVDKGHETNLEYESPDGGTRSFDWQSRTDKIFISVERGSYLELKESINQLKKIGFVFDQNIDHTLNHLNERIIEIDNELKLARNEWFENRDKSDVEKGIFRNYASSSRDSGSNQSHTILVGLDGKEIPPTETFYKAHKFLPSRIEGLKFDKIYGGSYNVLYWDITPEGTIGVTYSTGTAKSPLQIEFVRPVVSIGTVQKEALKNIIEKIVEDKKWGYGITSGETLKEVIDGTGLFNSSEELKEPILEIPEEKNDKPKAPASPDDISSLMEKFNKNR